MYGQMDMGGWTDGQLVESWMYGEKDTDGQTDGWLVERWTYGQKDTGVDRRAGCSPLTQTSPSGPHPLPTASRIGLGEVHPGLQSFPEEPRPRETQPSSLPAQQRRSLHTWGGYRGFCKTDDRVSE